MIIDTHVHLAVKDFAHDLPEVLERAQAVGVQKFIIPGVDRASFFPMMEVVRRYPDKCFPAVGLHPIDVFDNWQEELNFVEEQLSKHKFVAIGETGMDMYHNKAHAAEQRLVFEAQINWSLRYNLPLIVHSRDAFDELFSVLDKFKGQALYGVFHAFSGSIEIYRRIQKYGDFKMGIGGVVTFKNAGLANVVKNCSLSDIILETDAPWLSPVPFRGQRNESAHLSYVVAKIAELKGCSREEVEETTTRTALTLFPLMNNEQ
ncbi:MAG: TatD family hydrolase [Bacteroidales bacterium]|nr:TatD family hydrolase [Bacteroidales bacterium]MCL2133205.1 TatD family hydrolase [Bacteroidales bacterium]